jgi:hypothetical protein
MSKWPSPVSMMVRLTYSLIIITARSESQREGTEDWIAMYMPDSELASPASLQELTSSL